MGIFSSIKNAIFGEDEKKAKDNADLPRTSVPRSGASAPKPAARSSNPVSAIDVTQSLDSMAGADRLNWRTSIVDLMKLIGVDPSYENRKALAQEMGRTDYEGTAEDNVWLHRVTMQRLAQSGGKVPAEYLD